MKQRFDSLRRPNKLIEVVLFVACISLLVWPQSAQAAVIPVTTIAPGVVDDGACSLAEAIIAANTNSNVIEDNCTPGGDLPTDTIVLATATTYTLPVIFDTYAGPFGALPVGLPAITSTLTISGHNAIIERRGIDLFGLLYISPTVGNLTMQDVSLRYGRTAHGGAIFNQGAVALFNTIVFSNTATSIGGAIFNHKQSTLTLIDSRVTFNSAEAHGGGIANDAGSRVTLTNATLAFNRASGHGGGIYNLAGSAVVVAGSHLFANPVGLNGGGIYNDSGSTVMLVNATVVSNSAFLSGGGIHNSNISTATITTSSILSNTARIFGGGVYNEMSSVVSLMNSTVDSNTANSGAGIHNREISTATLTNSTVISNTASGNGGGVATSNNSSTTLTGSTVVSNTARNNGGGIYTDNGSRVALVSSRVISNTARLLNGGGIFNTDASRVILSNSSVVSNTAGLNGGGIASLQDATAILTNSMVIANSAALNGGGITSLDATAILTNSTVVANRAANDGGGIATFANGSAYLANSLVGSNVAGTEGGGIYNEQNVVRLTNSRITANRASVGGGIVNANSGAVVLTSVDLLANTATSGGGGLYNAAGARAVLTGTHVAGNVSVEDGGGIYNESEEVEISHSRLLNNHAGENGGTIATLEDYLIEQSCIVDNSDVALFSYTLDLTDARNNWWGAPDGPGGAGPGSGDSISTGIEFVPFLTSAPPDCPNGPVEIGFSKQVTPAGNLLPGQPVTYTLTISNEDELDIHNIFVDDTLPAGFQLSQVITAGASFTHEGDGYRIPILAAGEVAMVRYGGMVDPTLNADQLLTNTGILSQVITGILSASVSSQVVLPKLQWSQAAYTTQEDSSDFEAMVLLSPTTPYTMVVVSATISGQEAKLLTFPPNSGSQAVVVDVPPVDGMLPARMINLGLLSPINALLGNPISATLTVENVDTLALVVSKHANPLQVSVGETITYSYHITNTGTITLTTIDAFDDALGSLPELENELTPQASAITTRTHVVVNEDLPGPLVNTVIVTGTDSLFNTMTGSAIVTVTVEGGLGLALSVTPSTTSIRLSEQITYSYRVTNTGLVALSNVVLEDARFGTNVALGTLAPGATAIHTHSHSIAPADLPGPIVNDATVTGIDNQGDPISASAGANVTIVRYETAFPLLKRQAPVE